MTQPEIKVGDLVRVVAGEPRRKVGGTTGLTTHDATPSTGTEFRVEFIDDDGDLRYNNSAGHPRWVRPQDVVLIESYSEVVLKRAAAALELDITALLKVARVIQELQG